MAPPMTAKRFTDLLTEWGIRWVPIRANWAVHNRAGHGEWGPVNGVGMHHTGSNGKVSDQEATLWNGYGDLPGPLCHAGIDPAGILRLAGWGRANHFGLGSSQTLKHVINQDYTSILKPGVADTDGNAHFYGFEIMYDGTHAMSDAQRKSAVRVAAMICTEHNWKPQSVIAHAEWQQGKWDPGYQGHVIPMDVFRHEVEQAQKAGPKPPVVKPPAPAPKPSNPAAITVKVGDTLWDLSTKYLGDGNRWLEFVKSNPKLARLQPGESIIVPKK